MQIGKFSCISNGSLHLLVQTKIAGNYMCMFMLSRVDSHLSLGLSTYFLNCLTLLKVCSASSLEGSMISALGPWDDVFTWLTLALPAQTEQGKLLNKYWCTDNSVVTHTHKKDILSYFLSLKHWINKPVWEDLAVCPSGALSRAKNPLLGMCLKSSPPKLNLSSAFC